MGYFFPFAIASRPATHKLLSNWDPGALSRGVRRPGREADHSPPSSVDVKNAWSCNSTSPTRLHGVVLS
jgi:hypothetical protein